MEHTNPTILRYFKEYELTLEQLNKLQNIMLNILEDVHNLCVKNGLKYMLCGGTLLGAIRHHGFIPWDDDVDIMMPRKDYDKLGEIIKSEYKDKYFVSKIGERQCPFRMMKIMLKGTIYREILRANHPYSAGIFIDVFPIDNIPKHHKIRQLVFNFSTKAFFAIQDYKHPSKIILDKSLQNKELKKYYSRRRRVGQFCQIFFGLKFYTKIITKLAHYPKKSCFEGIPLGIYYGTEIFDAGTFYEVSEADFCGHKFFIPKNYDLYLTNLYGNYMQLPPLEKRRRHQVAELDFGIYE